jgi:alkylation response protein AidB-like acyl-CoA dehydrogenase
VWCSWLHGRASCRWVLFTFLYSNIAETRSLYRPQGDGIGIPPLLNFGTTEIQDKYLNDVFAGKKFIALAISEAFAGSDVSGLQTTAVRDGDFWVVNGTKKWITNGTFADYFTTGCRTEVCTGVEQPHERSAESLVQNGFTTILIPRGEGVETKAIKTSYSATAGTAYVTFDNVRVPVSNTLGEVGKGMQVILSNFVSFTSFILMFCFVFLTT